MLWLFVQFATWHITINEETKIRICTRRYYRVVESVAQQIPTHKAADVIAFFSLRTWKTKIKSVVPKTACEPAARRVAASTDRLNQLDHRGNCVYELPTIMWYLPPFSREHDRKPLPFCVPLVLSMFFICHRVFGPKTEHESFFRSLISRMRLANLRETKRKPPLSLRSIMVSGSLIGTADTIMTHIDRAYTREPHNTLPQLSKTYSKKVLCIFQEFMRSVRFIFRS